MDPESTSPLLATSNNRPSSNSSKRSDHAHESTPLLSQTDGVPGYDGDEAVRNSEDGEAVSSPAEESLRSLDMNGRGPTKKTKSARRWLIILAVFLLGSIAVGVILVALLVPPILEEYAKESVVLEPTNLSVDKFTSSGLSVRVQGYFRLDAARVKDTNRRNIGKLVTSVARYVDSDEFNVELYLPEYDNLLIGTVAVPPYVVDVRDGHSTLLNFTSSVKPGDVDGMRQVANDWFTGHLKQLRVQGKADVGLKYGSIPIGTPSVVESYIVEGQSLYCSLASFYSR